MAARHRENSSTTARGLRYSNGNYSGGGTFQNFSVITDDVVGPLDNQVFSSARWNKMGGVINKPHSGVGFGSGFWDYYADYQVSSTPGHITTDAPTNSTAAVSGVARSNPSRPYVDLVVDLLELGDITKLLRDSGRSLIRKMAGANIKYEFGIKPLASDIAKLLLFQHEFNKRMKEIDKLAGPRGLRRTITIGTYSNSVTNNVTVQSAGTFINVPLTYRTSEEVKVHCRWKAVAIPGNLRAQEVMQMQVKRALLGLTIDFSTVWELIPWSWLIDWMTNVGQYLAANRNIIPASLESVKVLRHRRSTTTSPSVNSGGVTMTPFNNTAEHKSRANAVLIPTAHFPLLNGTQVGILASLSVLRGRR